MLGEKTADLVRQPRSIRDQPVTDPMHRLDGELST
jgi:hypothetical protein